MKAPNIQGLNNGQRLTCLAHRCENPKYSGAEQLLSATFPGLRVVKAPNIQGLNNKMQNRIWIHGCESPKYSGAEQRLDKSYKPFAEEA